VAMFAGTVTVGPVVSSTLTVKLPGFVLPCASVAEQFTVVGPSGNVDPDGGLHITGTGPSTLSFADAEYVTTAPAGLIASRVWLFGRPRNGALCIRRACFRARVSNQTQSQ
jgi:hypothetical protein